MWTDERIERAKQLNAQGLHPSQIALDLGGVTRNAVIGKLRRLGVQLAHAGHLFGGRPRKTREAYADRALSMKFKRTVADNNRYGTAAIVVRAAARAKQISEAPFLNIPFLDLEPQHCRYPRGGDDGEPVMFCGQPRIADSSYCQACHARCYVGKPAREISEEEHERRAAAARRYHARKAA